MFALAVSANHTSIQARTIARYHIDITWLYIDGVEGMVVESQMSYMFMATWPAVYNVELWAF